MKLSENDNIYSALIETAGHELYIATENHITFNFLRTLLPKTINNRKIKVACYQAYAECIRGLYEYYLAIFKWNEKTTTLPKHFNIDAKMNDAAQRLLNFHGPLRKRIDPSFPNNVPEDFGCSFRSIRNRVSHADYRRMFLSEENNNISLASFYKRYNFYIDLLLETPQFSWGGNHYENSYKWESVEDFIRIISD